MPVAATCPVHGPFASRAYHHVSSIDVQMSGNVESCPRCGRVAQVMEGAFNFDRTGFAEALVAPAWSRYALREVQADVQQLANAAEDRSLSDDDFERLADAIANRIGARDRRLGESIASQIRGKPRNIVLAFALGLVTLLGMISDGVSGGRLTYAFVEWAVHQVFGS